MTDLIYKNEVYEIVGAAMRTHNTLGYGFLEIVYKDGLEIELRKAEIPYSREQAFPVYYKDIKLNRTFYADFFVHNKLIVEIKTNAAGIGDDDLAQTLNYLKASGNKLGLIINFGKTRLEYKRVVF